MSEPAPPRPAGRVVVLGAYGLIGSACVRALVAAGFAVVGVGRSRRSAAAMPAGVPLLVRDLAGMTAERFAQDLRGAVAVVNAAGALQDGASDTLGAIHVSMVEALLAGLPHGARLVQISAAGAEAHASTAFMRTKAAGDRLVMASSADHVVLRPALVLSREAYGGTALMRAAAGLPVAPVRLFPQAPIQTVWVDDVAAAVVAAVRGEVPSGTVADLTEPDARAFADVLRTVRRWQGFGDTARGISVPRAGARLIGRMADAAARLGWRTPMRSTALTVLEEGVTGDPTAWRAAGGAQCRDLEATLAAMPAGLQERWFARLYLVLPAALVVLAAFWLLTGVVALVRLDEARAILVDLRLGRAAATLVTVCGAALDIAVGLSLLVRRLARPAALASVTVSLGYLAGATALAPELWLDPTGPLLKIVPQIMLALLVAAMLERR